MSTPSHSGASYRLDIDGLRAIAVIAVVLFHVDSTWLPGGFIGVDIFFVISGFLITSKIVEDYQNGSFSFSEFYRRRIRRIIPALFFVILATIIAAQFILLPEDFERLATTAAAAQLSVANIYFTYFLDTSYFAADANLEPLLHLWSLGVEEQFYLFWPALLVLGLGSLQFRWLFVAVAVAISISFLLGQLLVESHPMVAYYMLPTRAGQLLAGALAFFVLQRFPTERLGRWISESLCIAGLVLIVGSIWMLDHESHFPGLNAVPVTLGASLLVLAGSPQITLSGRLLALQPMVAVGRLSYSLYLWHWPVLSLARYVHGDLSLMMKLLALGAMTALSVLSYYMVEKPFRQDGNSFQTIAFRQLLIPTSIVLVLVGLVARTSGYGVYALDKEYKKALASLPSPQPASRMPTVCQHSHLRLQDLNEGTCKIGTVDVAKTFLWGDSHAGHYVGLLSEVSEELEFTFRNAAHSNCPPILSEPERFVLSSRAVTCQASGSLVRAHLHRFDRIVLAASWDGYLRRGNFSSELANTISQLVKAGKSVVVLGQVPRLKSFDNKCIQKALKIQLTDCTAQAQAHRSNVDATNRAIRDIALESGASYFDANDYLCTNGVCSGYLHGRLVYFDTGHLTYEGSRLLGQHVRKRREALSMFAPLLSGTGRLEAEAR